MSLETFNTMDEKAAHAKLLEACHCRPWANLVLFGRPYKTWEEFLTLGERTWNGLSEGNWLDAFEAHPEIGDVSTLKNKFRSTKGMASNEQSGVNEADEETLKQLVRLNKEYKNKFGFIFIVFATGKSARQMRDILDARMLNSRDAELKNAAREQWKITQLRLEKFFEKPNHDARS